MIFEILYNLIMGLLQGLTEWLPVSSSGHLVIAQHYFDVRERTLFDAILHLGTLFAALVYFRKDLYPLLNIKKPITQKIILASIPLVIFGFFLQDLIEAAFSMALVAAILLIINGCVLLSNAFIGPSKTGAGRNSNRESNKRSVETGKEKVGRTKKIGFKHALVIGLFQVFALLPGISRSGTTITTARVLGIDWIKGAKFSFFISFIPLAGAAGFKIITAYDEFQFYYLLGFIVSFLVGYATIDIMFHLIHKGKFHYFGVYTIILGVIIAIYLLMV